METTGSLLLLYEARKAHQAALLQTLAAALDGLADPGGQRIVAPARVTTLNSLAVPRLDGRSLATAFSLGARFVVRQTAGRSGLQTGLFGAMAPYWLTLLPRIDGLIFGTTVSSDGQAPLIGLDPDTDGAYPLLPADAHDGPRLRPRPAYHAIWRRPARSALDTARAAMARTAPGVSAQRSGRRRPSHANGKHRGSGIRTTCVAGEGAFLYVSQDQGDCRILRRHLASSEADGRIAFRQHAPQEGDWTVDIAATVVEAELILVLLSAEFLSTPSCRGDFEHMLNRSLSGQTRLIPVQSRRSDC